MRKAARKASLFDARAQREREDLLAHEAEQARQHRERADAARAARHAAGAGAGDVGVGAAVIRACRGGEQQRRRDRARGRPRRRAASRAARDPRACRRRRRTLSISTASSARVAGAATSARAAPVACSTSASAARRALARRGSSAPAHRGDARRAHAGSGSAIPSRSAARAGASPAARAAPRRAARRAPDRAAAVPSSAVAGQVTCAVASASSAARRAALGGVARRGERTQPGARARDDVGAAPPSRRARVGASPSSSAPSARAAAVGDRGLARVEPVGDHAREQDAAAREGDRRERRLGDGARPALRAPSASRATPNRAASRSSAARSFFLFAFTSSENGGVARPVRALTPRGRAGLPAASAGAASSSKPRPVAAREGTRSFTMSVVTTHRLATSAFRYGVWICVPASVAEASTASLMAVWAATVVDADVTPPRLATPSAHTVKR